MEINAVEIGKCLRELRGDKSREEVAVALDISQSALAMYEQGERIPRDPIKVRIANYYNKPIADIFFANHTHAS